MAMSKYKFFFKRLRFQIDWASLRKPLGAKVYISTWKESPTIVGRCFPSGKITLYAKRISAEETLEVLNHEVLHSILQNIFDFKTSSFLDRIHKWKGKKILFQGVEEDI